MAVAFPNAGALFQQKVQGAWPLNSPDVFQPPWVSSLEASFISLLFSLLDMELCLTWLYSTYIRTPFILPSLFSSCTAYAFFGVIFYLSRMCLMTFDTTLHGRWHLLLPHFRSRSWPWNWTSCLPSLIWPSTPQTPVHDRYKIVHETHSRSALRNYLAPFVKVQWMGSERKRSNFWCSCFNTGKKERYNL